MEIGQLEMEIEQLKYAAKLFLEMLKNHPELCPHDLVFRCSYPDTCDGKSGRMHEYRCGICGGQKLEFMEGED